MDSLRFETLIGDHAREITLLYQLVLNNLWFCSLQIEPSHPEICQTVNLSCICAGHDLFKLPDNIISQIFELCDDFEHGAYVLGNTLQVFPAVLSAADWLLPKKFQREICLSWFLDLVSEYAAC